MDENNKNHLKIVPFSGVDFSLGEVLANNDQTKINDARLVSAALSLYFQWEKHRSAQIYLNNCREGTHCQLDYDRDERSPTELWVNFEDKKNLTKELLNDQIKIRFEIFGVCYQFISKILKVSNEIEVPKKNILIINTPAEITVIKSRGLPRVNLTSQSIDAVYISWITNGKENKLKILEIGMNSLKGVIQQKPFEDDLKSENSYISLESLKINYDIVRKKDNLFVFKLIFKNGEESGKYFDWYRKFAYPELRCRHELQYDEGIELYYKSGYFLKYLGIKDKVRDKEIIDTWKATKSGKHITTADYYVVDKEEIPAGCSSIALAFYRANTPSWVLHQLCALKNPNLLLLSGTLYTWRAEYLSARPEALETVGYYDSRSRWLERLYTKHINFSKSESKLINLTNNNEKIEARNNEITINTDYIRFGNADRIIFDQKNYFGGINPVHLNAGGNLNKITIFEEKLENKYFDYKKILEQILFNKEIRSSNIHIHFESHKHSETLKDTEHPTNRMFIIPKMDLINFLSSVQHSVAVTEKKSS